jgi:hypothetical protein
MKHICIYCCLYFITLIVYHRLFFYANRVVVFFIIGFAETVFIGYNIPRQKQKNFMPLQLPSFKSFQAGYIFLILGIFSVSGLTALAQSSPNFSLGGGFNGGTGQSISGNFVQNCNGISGLSGQGASSNYSVTSGTNCDVPDLSINFRAAPEKRVPVGGLNLAQDNLQMSLYPAGSSNTAFISTPSQVIDTNGNSTTPLTAAVGAGQYDVKVKTSQHLTQKTSNITLNGGTNNVDLSNGLTQFLRAGDINGAGNTLGDDAVNALDISKEIGTLGLNQPQQDLNRDGQVNALDIGILLKNLGQTGD